MFGMPSIPYGLLGVAGGTDTRPTNTPEDMTALQKLYAAVSANNKTPNGRVARGFDQFGPQGGAAPAAQASQPQAPMLPTPPGGAAPAASTPPPVQMSPPVQAADDEHAPGALSSQQWAGPHSVGGAPVNPNAPMQANAAAPSPLDNAQWPAGPMGAPDQATGPDVIAKLMSYFKNKDNPSS
jgi:hypothetical protein